MATGNCWSIKVLFLMFLLLSKNDFCICNRLDSFQMEILIYNCPCTWSTKFKAEITKPVNHMFHTWTIYLNRDRPEKFCQQSENFLIRFKNTYFMVKMLQNPPRTNSYLVKKNCIFPFTSCGLKIYFLLHIWRERLEDGKHGLRGKLGGK